MEKKRLQFEAVFFVSMIDELIKALSVIDGIAGIVLGGSRGIDIGNDKSDYDIAIYTSGDKRLPCELIAKHIPKQIKADVNPVLISGYLGDIKFELFQKALPRIQQEVDNNTQGKFRWFLAPLLPYGDVSYRQVSHLVNAKVLFDRENRLQSIIDQVTPIPALFKKSVINHFFKQINNSVIHIGKVNKKEDQFHFMSLIGLIFFCYFNILYVLNNRYPIIEKGNIQVALSLANAPEDLQKRMSLIYSAASAFEFEAARKLMHALVADLKTIAYEEQKKQS